MIDQTTVEAIKNRAEIKDVVEDYLTLQRRGVNYVGLCPFHDDKRPSFYVSPSKNFCHCFVCGGGGNPISFIMNVENVSYYEALKILANKYHITIEEKEISAEERQKRNERESLMHTNEWLNKQFIQNLHESPEGQQIGMTYFMQKRKFRQDIISKFQLGYALKARESYTRLAESKGIKVEYLVKLGASIPHEGGPTTDRFASRAIFPIHSVSGQVIAFGGRTLRADDPVKYQNSPESDVYQKRFALYGLYFAKKAIQKEKKAYISEGYCDVISMVQAGIENIVAPCGTALTTEQIRLLKRVIPSRGSEDSEEKHVTMMYDGDGAGVNAALKNGRLLLEQGLYVHVVILPPEDDPDTFAQNHSGDEVKQFLTENEQDYVLFFAKHFGPNIAGNPSAKASAIMETASTIASIPDKIRRSVYIQECARLLDADEASLTEQVAELRRKKLLESYDKQQRSGQDYQGRPSVTATPTSTTPAQPTGEKIVTIRQADPTAATTQPQQQAGPYPDDIPPEAFLPEEFLQQQAATTSVPISAPSSPFEECERNLMHYLMKVGGREIISLYETDEKSEKIPITVAKYILLLKMEADNIQFKNPIYERIRLDILNHIDEPDTMGESYFLNNSDMKISQTASELLMDPRYPDNADDEDLKSTITHIVTDLQKQVMNAEVQQKKNEFETEQDSERRKDLMKQLYMSKNIYQQICKELGNVM